MASPNIGFATLSVIPSMRGVSQRMRSQLANVMPQAGREAGLGFGSGFSGAFQEVAANAREDFESLARWGQRGALAIGGIGAAVAGLALKGGIDRALNIEDAQAKLRGLGHDAESVETIMDSALASVKGTAFGLGDAATAAASAVAAGIEPGEELTRVLGLTADAATIMGRSFGDSGAIVNKILASNRVSMEEVNQLHDAGLPILAQLSEQYGVNAQAMREMVSQGIVDSEAFLNALETNIGGAALESGETFRGAMANVGAAMSRLGEAVVSPFLGLGKDAFGGLIEGIDELASRVGPAMEAFKESSAFETLQGHVERIPEYIGAAVEAVGDFWDATQVLREGIGNIVAGAVDIAQWAVDVNRNLNGIPGILLAIGGGLKLLMAHPAFAVVGGIAWLVGQIGREARETQADAEALFATIKRTGAEALQAFAQDQVLAIATTDGVKVAMDEMGLSLIDLEQAILGDQSALDKFASAQFMAAYAGSQHGGAIGHVRDQILEHNRVVGIARELTEQHEEAERARAMAAAITTEAVAGADRALLAHVGITREAATTTTNAAAGMSTAFEELQAAAAERFENILGSVQSFITGMEELPDAATTTADKFLSNLEERNTELETWFDNLEILASAGLGDLVQFAIDEGPEKMRELVASWAGDIPTAQNTNDMLAAGQELAEKGTRDLLGAEATANLIRAGRETVEGYARGIDIHTYIAAASARRMANAATRAASSELEVQSPSKVFERIGAFVPAGLADGIEKNLDPVRRAANLMVEASIPDGDVLQRRLGGLTPRIDPVDIEAQAAISYQARLREADVTAGSGGMGGDVIFQEGAFQINNPVGEHAEDTLAATPLAYAVQSALRRRM